MRSSFRRRDGFGVSTTAKAKTKETFRGKEEEEEEEAEKGTRFAIRLNLKPPAKSERR